MGNKTSVFCSQFEPSSQVVETIKKDSEQGVQSPPEMWQEEDEAVNELENPNVKRSVEGEGTKSTKKAHDISHSKNDPQVPLTGDEKQNANNRIDDRPNTIDPMNSTLDQYGLDVTVSEPVTQVEKQLVNLMTNNLEHHEPSGHPTCVKSIYQHNANHCSDWEANKELASFEEDGGSSVVKVLGQESGGFIYSIFQNLEELDSNFETTLNSNSMLNEDKVDVRVLKKTESVASGLNEFPAKFGEFSNGSNTHICQLPLLYICEESSYLNYDNTIKMDETFDCDVMDQVNTVIPRLDHHKPKAKSLEKALQLSRHIPTLVGLGDERSTRARSEAGLLSQSESCLPTIQSHGDLMISKPSGDKTIRAASIQTDMVFLPCPNDGHESHKLKQSNESFMRMVDAQSSFSSNGLECRHPNREPIELGAEPLRPSSSTLSDHGKNGRSDHDDEDQTFDNNLDIVPSFCQDQAFNEIYPTIDDADMNDDDENFTEHQSDDTLTLISEQNENQLDPQETVPVIHDLKQFENLEPVSCEVKHPIYSGDGTSLQSQSTSTKQEMSCNSSNLKPMSSSKNQRVQTIH